MLVPTKAEEERSCKRGTIEATGASGIDMILALLEGVLGGLQVRDNWLEPEGTSPCKTLSSSGGLPRYT